MYYLSYMVNERWRGRPGFIAVCLANGVWVVGPGFGMYACYCMIMSDSYAFFRL